MEAELEKVLINCKTELQKNALFLAYLSREIEASDPGKDLTIVGGSAVEFYTQGDYSTKDIDVLAPKETLFKVLKRWGFIPLPDKRTWYFPKLDIRVEWVGRGMVNDDIIAHKRRELVSLKKGLKISIISREDIIIDRLVCMKWQNRTDDFNWAVLVFTVSNWDEKPIDIKYLLQRAKEKQFDVEDVVKKMITTAREFQNKKRKNENIEDINDEYRL